MGIPEYQRGPPQGDGKKGDQKPAGDARHQVRTLPCRLEEQTRRLQKDLKKSTDADLGRWTGPELDWVGHRWMPYSLKAL